MQSIQLVGSSFTYTSIYYVILSYPSHHITDDAAFRQRQRGDVANPPCIDRQYHCDTTNKKHEFGNPQHGGKHKNFKFYNTLDH